MSHKKIREYYISVDIEADGPCPGVNSMLQLGAVFYDAEGNVLEEFVRNIEPLAGAVQDPKTMKWWGEQEVKNPGLWKTMTDNQRHPCNVVTEFEILVSRHSKLLNAKPLVVAYPAGFDFTFLYYYLCRFSGESCVGFSALDMKTLSMTLLNRLYHDCSKSRFPRSWFNPAYKHTHNALDDAKGQGYQFFQMLWALKMLHLRQDLYTGVTSCSTLDS
jgi:DNA polymerase III alpha subunit (gram-positive type)